MNAPMAWRDEVPASLFGLSIAGWAGKRIGEGSARLEPGDFVATELRRSTRRRLRASPAIRYPSSGSRASSGGSCGRVRGEAHPKVSPLSSGREVRRDGHLGHGRGRTVALAATKESPENSSSEQNPRSIYSNAYALSNLLNCRLEPWPNLGNQRGQLLTSSGNFTFVPWGFTMICNQVMI